MRGNFKVAACSPRRRHEHKVEQQMLLHSGICVLQGWDARGKGGGVENKELATMDGETEDPAA